MKAGIAILAVSVVLGQFFRAFLTVLAPALGQDLGANAADLSLASGLWFGVFAAVQLPVGSAFDRIGPRRTSAVMLAIGGGGGTALFALATTAWQLQLAMALIGIGCAPLLMASYFIFARSFPPAVFASLAGMLIGVGSLGNLASATPLAMAADLFGWRASIWGMCALTLLTAAGIWLLVTDPPRARDENGAQGSVLDLLKNPNLLLIAPLVFAAYAPSAGIRGIWAGSYLEDVFNMNASQIGIAMLVMGVAMSIGSFAYGPMDRLLGSYKRATFWGSVIAALCLFALANAQTLPVWMVVGLMASIGFFGASYPALVAHGRSFLPAHLMGRGVTLLNLFSIGGVGLLQSTTSAMHRHSDASDPAASYSAIFMLFGVMLVIGCAVYIFAQDKLRKPIRTQLEQRA